MSEPCRDAKPHRRSASVVGCLGAFVRITAACITLTLLGIWGFDLWYRMTTTSKPWLAHVQDQWADLQHLIWLKQSDGGIIVNPDGTLQDSHGNPIPLQEVDNACLEPSSGSAPPPEAWRSLDTGTLLKQPSGYGIPSLVMTPDGKTLVSAGNQVEVWDLTTRQRIRILEDQTEFVYALALSPDGHTLATGDETGAIALWNLHTGQRQRRLSHGSKIYQLQFGADGKILFSSGVGGTIQRWNLETETVDSLAPSFPAQHMALTPDQQIMAIGFQGSKAVQILHLPTGETIAMPTHGEIVDAIAFNSTGRILASAGPLSSGIRLWDMQDKYLYQPIKTLQGHRGQPSAIAFSPDDKTLFATADAFGGRNYAVTVWNACTGELVHRFGNQLRGLSIAMSADGKTLATGGRIGDIQLWRLP